MTLRRLALACPRLTALLIALALAAKLLVPTGFMPMVSAQGVTLVICNGAAPQKQHVSGGHGSHHGQHDEEAPPAKSDPQCAFSGLSAPAIAAIDPLLLAIAIFFIRATSFQATRVSLRSRALHLRPPLRGPPLRA